MKRELQLSGVMDLSGSAMPDAVSSPSAPSPTLTPTHPQTAATGSARDAPETSASSRLPKKPLQSCRIEGYTIERCPSPRKKVLDPLRYIPERGSYFALFTVVARFEDHASDHQVYRTHQQFGALHSKLQKKFPKSKLPKELPTMRKKRFDNQYIEQKSNELNEYFRNLLELPEVRLSKLLREFLEDSQLSDASDEDDDDDEPTKVLDGLPGTIVTVRAGQSFSVSLNLQSAGDVASWQFTTKKHNVGFSATFNGLNVRVYSREESQVKPVKGSFKCTEPGTLTLDWDNTYAWSKTKVLIYWAEVKQVRLMSSATAPAPSATDATPPLVDARRSGYIAQSRTPALYPRQIVNSSISLITKPFISGKSTQAQFKSGLLIVERNLKFRGRKWYRKWFVLDAHKGLLRYYDSEAAARKNLSLAKMNLATKNACLAITSNTEAAPTPYLFMVRARKRSWKMCASSQAEYNEWEHAISTAILTAQLKRRTKSNGGEAAEDKADMLQRRDGNGQGEESEDDDDEDDEGDGDGDGDGDGGKDDDDESEDENENDSDPAHAMETGSSTPTRRDAGDVPSYVERTHPPTVRLERPRFTSIQAHWFWNHWFGDLRTLSRAKKVLLVIWINALVYSLRTSTLVVVASTVLVANGYLIIHALEAPRQHKATLSPPQRDKDKHV